MCLKIIEWSYLTFRWDGWIRRKETSRAYGRLPRIFTGKRRLDEAPVMDSRVWQLKWKSSFIKNVIELEQQVYVLNDVLQSAIQIIVTEHERRISQRIKRAGIRAWSKAARFGNRLWESTIFKVLGTASTIAFAIGVIAWVIRALRR